MGITEHEYLHPGERIEGFNYLPEEIESVINLPQLRTRTAAHPVKARDYPFPSVRVSCAKCGWQGHYSRDNFLELVGAETELPDALERISADCPKR